MALSLGLASTKLGGTRPPGALVVPWGLQARPEVALHPQTTALLADIYLQNKVLLVNKRTGPAWQRPLTPPNRPIDPRSLG